MPETDVLPTITTEERARAEKKALHKALYARPDAVLRWVDRRGEGLDDKALFDAIAFELQIGKTEHDLDGISYEARGGKQPFVRVLAIDNQPVEFDPIRGKALVARVRDQLGIPQPGMGDVGPATRALRKNLEKYNATMTLHPDPSTESQEISEPESEPETPLSVIRLKGARQMLAMARSVDDVQSVMGLAEAVRVVAQRRQLGLEVQNDAAELRIRAERRAGEMIREMEKNPGGDPVDAIDRGKTPPTLKELGISRDQSSKWQKIAAVDEDDLEEYFEKAREKGAEITTAGVLALNKPPAEEKVKPPPPAPCIQMWRYDDTPAYYRNLVREPEEGETVWIIAYPAELRAVVPWLEAMEEGMTNLQWGGLVFEAPIECDDGTVLEYAVSVVPREAREKEVEA